MANVHPTPMTCHWKRDTNKETTQCLKEASEFLGPCNPPVGYCKEHAEQVEANRQWLLHIYSSDRAQSE